MKKLNITYIGIGTNLGNKPNNIRLAYQYIQLNIGNITRKSKIYKSPPWGFESTEDFYNSVIEVNTILEPELLLDELQKIEKLLGKKQTFNIGYSSRLIDLDIIDFNNKIIDTERLSIPHSHLTERNFVLYPLFDVCPNWIHPKQKTSISELIKKINNPIATVDYQLHFPSM
jgi:2-amino-4-hydroxy-6-hydroxymethyldihydropteridine diphosphokinase